MLQCLGPYLYVAMPYKGFDGKTIPFNLNQFELFPKSVFLETGNQILCLISSDLYLCYKTEELPPSLTWC